MNIVEAGYRFGPLYMASLVEHDTLRNINLSGNDRNRNYVGVMSSLTRGSNIYSLQAGRAGPWTGAAGVADSGAVMGSLAYNYALSKSVQLYLFYTLLHGQTQADYVLGSNPTASVPQAASQHTLAIGMWQMF